MIKNNLPKCLDEKGVHQRDYMIEIYRTKDNGADSLGRQDVTYWCKECGAVAVDAESDRRFTGPVLSTKFPQTLIDMVK